MQKLVWQNANGVELDLTSGNYGITEWEGFSNASLNIQQQQVPFQDGGVFLDALIEQRELSVTLAMQDNNNLELRYQNRRELISALNPKLGEGYLIYTNDFISKRIKCVPQIPLFETHNSDTVGTPKASLSWTACSPYWEDLEETEVVASLGEVLEVNNEGDVDTNVLIETRNSFTDGSIRNITTGKTIGMTGNYDTQVIINTERGQKTAIEKVYGINWKSGGVIYDCDTDGFDTVFVGTKPLKRTLDGKYEIIKIPEIETTGEVCVSVAFTGIYWFVITQKKIFKSTDLVNWEKVYDRTGDLGTFRTCACGNGKIVVAGERALVVSTDFVNWSIPQADENSFTKARYLNGTFFLMCGTAHFLTSTDVLNWTLNPNLESVSASANDISYGNGVYLAMSNNASVCTSMDLTTWTKTSIEPIITVRALKFYQGEFYVLGYNSNLPSEQCGVCLKTRDLTTFEQISLNTSNLYNAEIIDKELYIMGNGGYIANIDINGNIEVEKEAFSANIIKAICKDGTLLGVTQNGYFRYTADLQTWEDTDCTEKVSSFTYGNNGYIAITYTGSTYTWRRSLNGKNWTVISPTEVSGNGKLSSANGKYFCLKSNKLYRSEDGIEWELTSITNSSSIGKVIYGNGKYYTFTQYRTYESTDGLTWTSYTKTTTTTVNDYAYGDGMFVLVAGSNIYYSRDAINFIVSMSNDSYYSSVVYNGFDFWISGLEKIANSANALSWTVQKVATNAQIDVLMNNNEEVIGVGYDSASVDIYSSSITNGDIFVSEEKGSSNIISNITKDSDMDFSLQSGINKIKIFAQEGELSIAIKYRQKYIGV